MLLSTGRVRAKRNGSLTATVIFTHEIDSLGHFDTVDSGTFTKLPSGDELETGQMPRPDLPGAPVRDYEEVWRDIDLPTSGVSWILESETDSLHQESGAKANESGEESNVVKTILGMVPGFFIALKQRQWHEVEEQDGKKVARKRGGAVSAWREDWNLAEDDSTVVIYAIGDDSKSLSLRAHMKDVLELNEKVHPGGMLIVNGCRYIVRAFER